MNTSVLHPPNEWRLSDDVIRNVVQHARYLSGFNTAPLGPRTADSEGFYTPAWKKPHLGEGVQSQRPMTDLNLPDEPGKLRETAFCEPVASNTAATTAQDSVKPSVNVARLIAMGQESLREARRQNQRRYRQKQQDHMVALEQETSKLQLQIKLLEQRRRAVTPTVEWGVDCAWSVAVEYFRLFQLGLREQTASSGAAFQARDLSSTQLSFLRSRLAQDVILYEGRGVDVAIYSWRRLSFWFKDFRLELEDLHKGGADSLVAITTTSVTITERTLRNVFPGVWNERESETGSVLVNKLLGYRIVMRGSIRFEWDPAHSLLSSMIAQSDLLTPMLRLLGSLDDVERVFAQAIISPDFHWTAPSSTAA